MVEGEEERARRGGWEVERKERVKRTGLALRRAAIKVALAASEGGRVGNGSVGAKNLGDFR